MRRFFKDNPNLADWLFSMPVFLVSAIYFLSYSRYGVNLVDSGYLFNSAHRILHGEAPGRDSYHFYPPGSFYLFAAFFSFFGQSMATGRTVLAILEGMEATLAWWCASRLVPRKWALLASLGILVCPGPRHKVFYGLGAFAVLLTLDWATDLGKRRGWFLYGVLLGLTVLFRQDIAVYGLILGLIAMHFLSTRDENKYSLAKSARYMAYLMFYLICGSLAATAPFLILWVSQGALWNIIHQVTFAAFQGSVANAIPFPNLSDLFAGDAINFFMVILFYMPFVVYIWGTIFLLKERFRPTYENTKDNRESRKNSGTPPALRIKLALYLLMGVFCLNMIRLRSDLSHLYQAIAPLFVIVPALSYYSLGAQIRKTRLRRLSAVMLALAPIALAATQTFSGNEYFDGTPAMIRGRNTRLDVPGGHLILLKSEADEIAGALEFINKNSDPGEPILVAPDASLFYFLSDRPNPTPYDLMEAGCFVPPEKQEWVCQQLRNHPPALVVYRNQEHLTEGRRFEAWAPQIYTFIRENYQNVGKSGSFDLLLLEKK